MAVEVVNNGELLFLWIESYSVLCAPVVDVALAVVVVGVNVVVGCRCRVSFEGGEVVGKFRFMKVKVGDGGLDVPKEDVPEKGTEYSALKDHVGDGKGSGVGAFDDYGGVARCEVVSEESDPCGVKSSELKFA